MYNNFKMKKKKKTSLIAYVNFLLVCYLTKFWKNSHEV